MENKKTLKVEFSESSKTCNATVKYEVEGENIDNDEVLRETQRIFNEAFQYSKQKTMEKSI